MTNTDQAKLPQGSFLTLSAGIGDDSQQSPTLGYRASTMFSVRPKALLILFCCAAIAQLSCNKNDEIRHYRVASQASSQQSVAARTQHRLLGAMIPHGDQTWFFKVTGSPNLLAKELATFRCLVQSISFEEGNNSDPHWTLPAGWRQLPPSGMRFATPNARIMVHQPSGGFQGQASDIERHARDIVETKRRLNEIYATHTGQSVEEIEKALDRDNFLSPEEAKDFGIIDEVVAARPEIGSEETTEKPNNEG